MKEQHFLLRSIPLLITMSILAGLAWSLQSALSARAQNIEDISPVAYAGPDQAVGMGVTVTLDGSGSYDPDNELPLSYQWAQTGGPGVVFNSVVSITTLTAPVIPTVLTFTLSVTDTTGTPSLTADEVVVRVLGQPDGIDDRGAGFTTDEDTPFVTGDVLDNDNDLSGSSLWVQSYDTSATLGQVSPAMYPGSLDTAGFNSPDGFVSVDYGERSSHCYSVAIQPDGKSIVAGNAYIPSYLLFAMARYNQDGSLDTTFGNGGVVTTTFNNSGNSWAIAIQPDGRILLAGDTYSSGDKDFALARYNSDGSLDSTFSSDGRATADFGSEEDEARSIIIQPDGKIVLGGSTNQVDFALARFNPDGSLDATFDTDGMVITDFGGNENISGITIQADSKIVATGTRWGNVNGDFILARYNPDGSLDNTFGNSGMVTTDFGGHDQGWPVIVQPNGKIVMAGSAHNGSNYDLALARYNRDGSLDTTFDTDGKVTTDFGGTEWGRGVLLQQDGRLIVAGETNDGSDADFALARYNPDGNLDSSFGQGGKSTANFDEEDYGYATALQADGNILMAGNTILARFASHTAGIFSYNPLGPFDYLPAGEVATDTFTYVVTNGILTDTAVVSITVMGVNYPPFTNAGRDQNVAALATVTLDGRGSSDPDGDFPLSYRWTQTGSPAVTFNPALSVTTFTAPAIQTVLTFTLSVTDHAGLAASTPDETMIRVFGQPIAYNDSGSGYATNAITPFLTADVLDNDIEPGGSPLWIDHVGTNETLGLVLPAEPAGSLDTASFNPPQGYTTIDFGGYDEDSIQGLVVQADGMIIAAGSVYMGSTENDFALARFHPDGSLDTTFGVNGIATTDFNGDYDRGMGVALQKDNKIVVAGYAYHNTTYNDFALARYGPGGNLDATFGNEGKLTLDFNGSSNELYAVAIQPDGKIVAAGFVVNTGYDFALVRYNPDGSLDTAFGANGIVVTDFGGYEAVHALILRPDGKIVAAGYTDDGYTSKFAVASYNPDGSADTDFGSNGQVTTSFYGLYDEAYSIALQPDGKIIAAGYTNTATDGDIALARYNPDGSLDISFGDNGKVATDVNGLYDRATAIAIQNGGKIVIGGNICYSGCDSLVARYTQEGHLDITFGSNGIVVSDFGGDDYVSTLAIQEDGKILEAGGNTLACYTSNANSGVFIYDPNAQFDQLAAGETATDTFTYIVTNGVLTDTATVSITVTGVNDAPIAVDDSGAGFTTDEDTPFVTGDVLTNDVDPEGDPLSVQSIDTSGTLGLVTWVGEGGGSLDGDGFGIPNGYISITFGGSLDWAMAVTRQTDNKIVVAGYTHNDGTQTNFALARYNSDGSPDTAFGSSGVVTTDFNAGHDIGSAIAVQQDNKIIVAGTAYNAPFYADFALARYNPDGSLDTTFGDDGKVLTDFAGSDEEIYDIAIQLDGKIVATGYTFTGSEYDFALARYNPDGNLDSTFGSGGKQTVNIGDFDQSRAIAIKPDGKIVVVGRTDDETSVFAVACFNPDGSPDTTFSSNGLVTTDFYGIDEGAEAVTVQPTGEIIAAGYAYNGSNDDIVLARYNPDGSLDITFDMDGKVTTDFDGGYEFTGDLALQPDGKIIVVGGTSDEITYYYSAVVRYNSAGSLDPDFGEGGRTLSDFGYNQAHAVALQPDGKIVTAGGIILARYTNSTISGELNYDPNGQFDYLSAGEVATDTFTYMVTDGVLTDTATVSITVTGVNDSPVAVDDGGAGFTTDANSSFVTTNVTANDQDIDGDLLSVSSFDTNGTFGLVTYTGGGSGLPGSLDVGNFGAPNGFIMTDFGGSDIANDLALLSDGKIMAGGIGSSYMFYDFALAQYNPDGSPDISFGSGGTVLTDFGGNDRIEEIAIQPDGKIVAAGYTDSLDDIALARYNPNGSLDTTFGSDGMVTTDFYGNSDNGDALALQNDGKIVVAGYTWMSDTQYDFALARYNPDGSLDTTFDGDGKVTTDFGNSSDHVHSVAILPDEKILVAGFTYTSNGNFALARYNPDGSLDSTFSGDGKITTDFGADDLSYGLTIQPYDGKIILVGSTCVYYDCDMAVARYETNGDLDLTFGNEGKVTTAFGIGVQGYDLAIQANHQIVVAGTTLGDEILYDFALARYNPDGSLDTLFGTDGRVVTDFFDGEDNANAIVIQPDGQIVVAGGAWQYVNPGFDFTVARYNSGGGIFTYDPNGQFDHLSAGEVATDTFIYVVTDDVLTDTATVSITVIGVNDPPSFTSTPVTTAVSMIFYTDTITTDDLDSGDFLIIAAPTLPAWLTLADHGDRTATLSGTPLTPGSFPVALEVSDGISSAMQAFTITVSASLIVTADLSVSQSFQWTSSGSGVITLVASNLGPQAAPGTVVSDTLPASFSGITWTCTGAGGAACTASGTGNLHDTLTSFPAGGVVTYTITVTGIALENWSNTTVVLAPAGISDPDLANNQATYTIQQVLLPVIFKQYLAGP